MGGGFKKVENITHLTLLSKEQERSCLFLSPSEFVAHLKLALGLF